MDEITQSIRECAVCKKRDYEWHMSYGGLRSDCLCNDCVDWWVAVTTRVVRKAYPIQKKGR